MLNSGLTWKRHWIKKGNFVDGYSTVAGQMQYLPDYGESKFWPFSMAKMDNGEIILAGIERFSQPPHINASTLITFSRDNGETWDDYIKIPNCYARPMMLACCGNGLVTFSGNFDGTSETMIRAFSKDYGRTWDFTNELQQASDGFNFITEGNALVESDADGNRVVCEVGFTILHRTKDNPFPICASVPYFRRSYDNGATWVDEIQPTQWNFEMEYQGKPLLRSCCEGAITRAKNGWLVVAWRTDMDPCYFDLKYCDDSLMGTAVSISKDNGKTWSDLQFIFEAGRHHANLLTLENGDIVMTVIKRVDIQDKKLASYNRGCEAILSRDNGLTWDVNNRYVLDEFPFYGHAPNWVSGEVGHLYSMSTDGKSILTAYANYVSGGTLIRWSPEEI